MQPPIDAPSSRFWSLPVFALTAFGAITTGLVVLPGPARIHERIEKNRLCAKITPLLAEARFDHGVSPTDALLALPAARLGTLEHLAGLPPMEQLHRIFETKEPLKYDKFIHAFTLAAIRKMDAVAPEEAFDLISAKSPEMPEKERLEVFDALVASALASSQNKLAAEILRLSCCSDLSTWSRVKQMADVSRPAGSQAPAVEELRKWLGAHEGNLTKEERIEAGSIRYTLAMEASLPSEALDQCLRELKDLSDVTRLSPDLLDRMHRAATLAGRGKDILPWVESYLASLPEAALSWQELLTATASDEYKRWVKCAADIADGAMLAGKACAHHQRLLAMGDTSGLSRLMPLSTHVGRSEETAQILQAVGQKPGNEKLPLHTARAIALNGRPAQAAGMFEEWASSHPADRDAAFELACLKESEGDIVAAVSVFESFLRSFPADPAAVKKLALLRIRNDQPESALRELDSLREQDFDAETLTSYRLLAESLGRAASLQRAMRIAISDPSQVTPDTFIRMAEVAQQTAEDGDAPLAALREGLKHLPQSPSIHRKLASLLLEREQYDDALTQALHPSLKSRFDAMAIALSAAIHTQRCGEAVSMAGPDFEKNDALSTHARIDFAVACCLAGDTARGKAVFASIRPDSSNCAKLAEAHLLAGHADQAEILAQRNIAHSTAPKSSDWILLGDARAMQGRPAEANDAYAKALSVASARISSTGSSDPVAASAGTANPVSHP